MVGGALSATRGEGEASGRKAASAAIAIADNETTVAMPISFETISLSILGSPDLRDPTVFAIGHALIPLDIRSRLCVVGSAEPRPGSDAATLRERTSGAVK